MSMNGKSLIRKYIEIKEFESIAEQMAEKVAKLSRELSEARKNE